MRLREHGISVEHITNMTSWNQLRIRLKKQQTIYKELQQTNLKRERALKASYIKNSYHCNFLVNIIWL